MFPVAFRTIGCKLNQIESEALADSFAKAGFTVVPPATKIEGAGIVIVNTCTVTSKAEQKTRMYIRKALRQNPAACVIVTGCYAKLDPAEVEALEEDSVPPGAGRIFVPRGEGGGVGTDKSALLELPGFIREAALRGNALPEILGSWMARKPGTGGDPFGFRPDDFTFHSRGFLKVQDGCDGLCTYCRTRLARGPSVSVSPKAALAELRSFEEKGCPELVIAGVNLVQYRHSGFGLAGLLRYLLENSESAALRVSSLEPEGINEELASALAHPRIRPHFHLSVQSGSDSVLRRMGRNYPARAVEEAAVLLRYAKGDPFMACDVIAGFPGESEEDFDLTLALCEKTKFAWIHSFPFSPRPGTRAFSFDGRVRESEVKRRADALVKLAWRGRREYAGAWLGREVSAVVERGQRWDGQCSAVSENYLKLIVNCGNDIPAPGSSVRCLLTSLCRGGNGENPDAVADLVRAPGAV